MGEVRFADSRGVRIAYEIDGDAGPWLVLQHGLGYHRTDWEPVIDGLAARCRVVRIDPRGAGDSDVPPAPWTIADVAADLLAVVDDVGIDRGVVVGMSQGGGVVQEFADAHPDRVERLVMCAPLIGERALYPDTVVTPTTDHALVDGRGTLRALVAGADPADVLDLAQMRRNVAAALAPATERDRPELIDHIFALRAAKPVSPAGWLAQDFAGAAYRYTADIPDLSMPVLVLHGTEDRVVSPAVADVLEKRLSDIRVVRLEGLGHLPHWEVPERFVDLLTTFALDGTVAA